MENWQLTLIVLGAVIVGASIPVFIMLWLALFRASREMAEFGRQLAPTLAQIQTISTRVEIVSRGLEGGETRIAEFLAAIGALTGGLERNMKLLNFSTAMVAAAGPVLASLVNSFRQPDPSALEPDADREDGGSAPADSPCLAEEDR